MILASIENKEKTNMSNEVIKLDKSEATAIQQMSPNELKAYAEKKSAEILEMINESTRKVAQAKDAAETARNMKISWFFGRGTAKKTNATAEAVTKTNLAVAELAQLTQNTIQYTCMSIEFARVMHQTMARMMASGFKDAHGCIQTVDANAQEFVQHILDEAESFAKNQKAVEERQAAQDKKLSDISQLVQENRKKLQEKDNIDAAQQKCIDKNRADISTNRVLIEENRNNNKAQDEELQRQAKKDIEHDTLITRLFQEAKGYDARLTKMEKDIASMATNKNTAIISLAVSLLALIISILAAFGVIPATNATGL